ncbi:MAG: ATP synthase F1 subunit gamma [Acidobacteriota bacterium]|nr:ATP synthase F1 subunit gamma [Acidobacteriota bacterium]
MANRRVLVKRRKASRNIRKITRTMQLIATARFQAAYSAAVAGRPYTDKLAQLVGNLARAASGIDHPLMHQPESEKRAAVLILTSNRGLCGGYNSNVLRKATEHLDELAGRGVGCETHMIGKKGIGFFGFLGREMDSTDAEIGETVRFEKVEPLANQLIERFTAGEIDAVYVAYTKFISTARQAPVVEKLLPLEYEAASAGETGTAAQYEFSPDPQSLLSEILPATVRVRLFQSFTDAAVSEQVARMVAMKAATDAAEDMIKRLTQQYNRARQTQITMELLDIVGGANALA